jgi:hypothetical protein
MIKHRSNPNTHHEAFSVDEGYQTNNLSSLMGSSKPDKKKVQPYRRFLEADPNDSGVNDRAKLKKQMFTSIDA